MVVDIEKMINYKETAMNEIPLGDQLHCINCRTKQDDLDRMHIHMGEYNRIIVGFWCISCGHENEFTITRINDKYPYYFEHLEVR